MSGDRDIDSCWLRARILKEANQFKTWGRLRVTIQTGVRWCANRTVKQNGTKDMKYNHNQKHRSRALKLGIADMRFILHSVGMEWVCLYSTLWSVSESLSPGPKPDWRYSLWWLLSVTVFNELFCVTWSGVFLR